MAYAEPVKSPKGTYWRGRYKDPEGRYVSVRDEHDRVIRFDGKREARKAAEAAEADVSAGRWRDPKAGEITFLGWANNWYRGLDLAPATMANRKRHLENHLIPFFGEKTMREIEEGGAALVLKWERAERDAGKSAGSIKAWRGTLHLVLEDARGMHISVNPATRKKGRGKRSGGGRSRHSGPEKAFTTPLGVLLIAERMSILTGRDDEFVMVEAKYWEVLRLGELVGLEKPFVRQRDVRVEWQLSEVDGVLLRVPPKDDSFGNPVMPLFMRQLLTDHMRRVPRSVVPATGSRTCSAAMVFRSRYGNRRCASSRCYPGSRSTRSGVSLAGRSRCRKRRGSASSMPRSGSDSRRSRCPMARHGIGAGQHSSRSSQRRHPDGGRSEPARGSGLCCCAGTGLACG